jgi:hypothetical protein
MKILIIGLAAAGVLLIGGASVALIIASKYLQDLSE